MINVKTAREILADYFAENWPYPGSPYVGRGYSENAQFYLLNYNTKEYLVNRRDDFFLTNLPIALVDKETRRLSFITYLENFDFVSSFEVREN